MSKHTNNGSILEIKNLKKFFENVKAVNDLTFTIRSGEVYGLLGPNGAGKTTTIKCILGLLDPDSGNINVLGMDPENEQMEIKKLIGYVSEEPLLYKSLTPMELFEFIISVRNLDPDRTKKIVDELVDSLEARKYINSPIVTLSKGNKQKMQIISSLIHDPELLILDEPLSGLDARSDRVVKDILQIHKDNGGAVLFSTHILDVAEDICDRIGILNNGKLVAEGTLEELRKVAQEVGASSLEDIFLKLTEQDESVKNVLGRLKETLK